MNKQSLIIIKISIMLFLMLSIFSCRKSTTSTYSFDRDNLELNEEQEEDIESNSSIESLKANYKDLNNLYYEMNSEITELKSQNKDMNIIKLWIIIISAISFISICLSLIAIIYDNSLKSKIENIQNKLQKNKYSFKESSYNPQQGSINYNSYEVQQLKMKISELEKKIYGLSFPITEISNTNKPFIQTPDPDISLPPQEKNGYFGNPIKVSQPYFEKIINTKNSDARFSVRYNSTKAFFRPLEGPTYLGALTTSDNLRLAVEFTGCDPRNAKIMTIGNEGEAELKENRWYITKKALVILS